MVLFIAMIVEFVDNILELTELWQIFIANKSLRLPCIVLNLVAATKWLPVAVPLSGTALYDDNILISNFCQSFVE